MLFRSPQDTEQSHHYLVSELFLQPKRNPLPPHLPRRLSPVASARGAAPQLPGRGRSLPARGPTAGAGQVEQGLQTPGCPGPLGGPSSLIPQPVTTSRHSLEAGPGPWPAGPQARPPHLHLQPCGLYSGPRVSPPCGVLDSVVKVTVGAEVARPRLHGIS